MLRSNEWGHVQRVRVEQGKPAQWPTRTGYAFRKELVPGGVLLNEGIHVLDMLFWWFGTPKKFEYADDAIGGVESNVRLQLEFSNGIKGSFRLSRTCNLDNQFAIETDLATVSLLLHNQSEVAISINGKTQAHQVSSTKLDFVDSLAAQLQDFVECIRTGKAPPVTGHDGLRVVEFIEQCYASKRSRPPPVRAPLPGWTW